MPTSGQMKEEAAANKTDGRAIPRTAVLLFIVLAIILGTVFFFRSRRGPDTDTPAGVQKAVGNTPATGTAR